MLDYETTLILFGRSPFINEIKEYIPALINKYHTMGCNYFCESFPEVEYVIFFDDIVPKVSENSTIITNVIHIQDVNKKCYELCSTHPKTEFYTINRNAEKFATGDRKLNFCIHTPSMALNWAYKNGFSTVVLCGIDLVINTPHFDANTTPDDECPDFTQSAINVARKHLTTVAAQYLKIYQLNPESDLDICKISINELLN